MAVKRMVIDCDCVPAVCEHAYEKVSELLQSGYDDGYDEGWKDAFVAIKQGLLDMGFEKASSVATPAPPPRRGAKSKSKRRTSGGDLVN